MSVPRELWFLPRPSKSKYQGSFPLHFEKKLFELYPSQFILQPFGGMADYGLRCDLNNNTHPNVIADAHNLPFRDNTFDFVLCDPPYSNELSELMYGTPPIHWAKYTNEAVRVAKRGGYIGLYHTYLNPRPEGTSFDKIIVILTRFRHLARICCIFRKE